MHSTELRSQLAQFTGSSTFTRHALIPRMLMTEGVVYLAQAASAHWLTDAIGSYLLDKRAQQEPCQAWRLYVDTQSCSALLTMTDGNGSEPITTQQIDYTDCPLEQIDLWLVADGQYWVLMLPTEY